MKKPAAAKSAAATKKPRESKGLSDASLVRRTGKSLEQWGALLDKAGAKKEKWTHQQVTAFLDDYPELGAWWGQMTAVAYEQSRGLREKFQKCDGEFAANGSRTINVPIAKLYSAFSDAKQRDRWIPGAQFEITTETKNKSIRGKWDGATRVSINFYAKAPGKTMVAVDHMKLPNSKASAAQKQYWFDALTRLEELVTA
jgi:hypothetical protein